MPDAAAIVAKLDAIAALVAELRAEVAGAEIYPNLDASASDLDTDNLIEISTAMARFNRPADSLRWMCRTQGCGRKIGGRWLCSPARIERWLNGK